LNLRSNKQSRGLDPRASLDATHFHRFLVYSVGLDLQLFPLFASSTASIASNSPSDTAIANALRYYCE